MALILNKIYNQYTDFMSLVSENTGQQSPITMHPVTVAVACVVYAWVVTSIGPRLMQNRKPYSLRYAMLTYNALQMLFNSFLCVYATAELLLQGDPFVTGCIRPTPALVFSNQLYFMNKFTDMIETVIFVLRKKNNQISFLHVYHHICVVWGAYFSLVLCPGGHQVIPGVVNSFVHALMYTYYFVSIYDADIAAKFPQFKKRMTQIQLIQFTVLAAHFAKAFVGYCYFPMFLAASGLAQDLFFFCMFGDFYYRTYISPKKVKA